MLFGHYLFSFVEQVSQSQNFLKFSKVGARPLIDFKIMVAVSCLILSWTVGHLSSFIKFAAGAS